MKQTIDKQEVNNELNELKDLIKSYYDSVEIKQQQVDEVVELERGIKEIRTEIEITHQRIQKPTYPDLNTVEEVDVFLKDFMSPQSRLELLLVALDQLHKKLISAQSNNNRRADFSTDYKKDAWLKLAKILIKPIHNQLNETIYAIRESGHTINSFIDSVNEDVDFNQLGKKLSSDYGMPK